MLDGAERASCRRTRSSAAASSTSPRIARSSPGSRPGNSSSLSGTARARYDLVHELFLELHERAEQKAGRSRRAAADGRDQRASLLNENRILLVDEPTKGLAPLLVTEVARVFERVRGEDGTPPPRRAEPRCRAPDRPRRDRARRRPRHLFGSAEALLSDPDQVNSLLGVAGGAH